MWKIWGNFFTIFSLAGGKLDFCGRIFTYAKVNVIIPYVKNIRFTVFVWTSSLFNIHWEILYVVLSFFGLDLYSLLFAFTVMFSHYLFFIFKLRYWYIILQHLWSLGSEIRLNQPMNIDIGVHNDHDLHVSLLLTLQLQKRISRILERSFPPSSSSNQR